MKIYHSSVLRPFGSLLRGLTVITLILAAILAFAILALFSAAGEWSPGLLRVALVQPLFLLPGALVLIVGLPIAWSAFTRCRGCYRAGPTDLEIRNGWPRQSVQLLRYADIRAIDLSRGPFMRLIGTTDLVIRSSQVPFQATLYGIRDAGELRESLLGRRDSLRELLVDGGGGLGALSQDMILERLARVLERLEKRLP